jgi:hypothetical protein
VGADAEIFVFDYERYRWEIVPALLSLLRTGSPVPWLAEVLRDEPPDGYGWTEMAARFAARPTDLAAYCDWLGDDLRYGGDGPVVCPSVACPERDDCPFHRSRRDRAEVNALHQALVVTRCLGPGQFVGRGFTPYRYQAVGDRVRELLAQLGRRGAVLGFQFVGTDGIHGWLTGPETAELALLLDALPLPRFEASFGEMARRHRVNLERPGESWEELSLAFVRTVSAIAAGEGRAVLWGHDVIGPAGG